MNTVVILFVVLIVCYRGPRFRKLDQITLYLGSYFIMCILLVKN